MRYCPGCLHKKRLTSFYKSTAAVDGASSYCRDCTCRRTAEYRKNHPIRVSRYQRHWRIQNPIKFMLAQTKTSAKKRGIAFNITEKSLQPFQVLRCPILGMRLIYGGCNGHAKPNSASIDRINSSRGYVRGNIAIISYRANLIKNDGSADEHRRIAAYMDARNGANR